MFANHSPPRAAYVHVPFCRHRCGYCNFTLVAGRDDLIDDYLTAIDLELQTLGKPREVDTLFFGGGTPTHLPQKQLEQLLACVRRWFPLAEGHELSVEANPADLSEERIDLLAAAGTNRLSLGGQSFHAEKLVLLERDHDAEQLHEAIERTKQRIGSLSLDLIFGTPGETLDVWQADLRQALDMNPQHLSTYGLTFERGTAFWNRLQSGALEQLGEETERAMYAAAIDGLTAAGFEHYEVSNFARPGHRCRHNEVYWQGGAYYAVGPGASRYVDGRRETNHRSTTTWLKRVLSGQSPVAESETLEPEDRARELLVFALRRLEGIEREDFSSRTGFDLDALVGKPLERMTELRLLDDDGRRVRLTREGLFVSDAIWPEFLRG
ncbi:MAG: coproporphyrinogen III oxidase family protein [Planctomycetota bacterium]|nr:MAG: coproporphyrinogen III oxidase family protein [Planctomycetota bacterium]